MLPFLLASLLKHMSHSERLFSIKSLLLCIIYLFGPYIFSKEIKHFFLVKINIFNNLFVFILKFLISSVSTKNPYAQNLILAPKNTDLVFKLRI